MNPRDFIIFLVWSGPAVFAMICDGWTQNAVGPALLLVAGSGWNLWMSRLRYQSWLQHRHSGFAPSTQYLALWGALGCLIATIAALVWVLFTHTPN